MFSCFVEKHSEIFGKTVNNFLYLCVSVECLDTGLTNDALVKQEATINCYDGK